ncbi:MAG: hypothetical protein ABIM60_04215 [candidate division WOR-3 bacterium]
MKKYIIGLGIILGIGIYFYGCKKGEVPETPNVHTVKIIQNGAGLRFEWDPVDNADGYRVYADGNPVYEGTNTYYELTTPAMEVKIVAYNDEGESDPWVGDYTPKSTANVIVYDALDPDPNHPSYIEFVNGVATPRNATLKQQAWMLFYKDSVRTNVHNNPDIDAAFSEISGNWEDAKLAPGVGNYITAQPAMEGAAYYIWFDFEPINTMGEEDYFAKMYISAKSGYQYTVSFYFQTTRGLRWLKTK